MALSTVAVCDICMGGAFVANAHEALPGGWARVIVVVSKYIPGESEGDEGWHDSDREEDRHVCQKCLASLRTYFAEGKPHAPEEAEKRAKAKRVSAWEECNQNPRRPPPDRV